VSCEWMIEGEISEPRMVYITPTGKKNQSFGAKKPQLSLYLVKWQIARRGNKFRFIQPVGNSLVGPSVVNGHMSFNQWRRPRDSGQG